ncbi:Na(+)/H(+) exchange regulatory cofactor NHE-RF2 isoform X2 [Danio rerio]|uniref:Na(+)/H(+) exchange regulatory cofactor NHE-RF2 isoform X2 n=1 Tax=Danio rerio TaxID=7955 RepID=A0AC58FY84_DANRE
MANTLEREILERELRPRLCYLTKGDRGYGFHLHGERNRGAQYIRKIEPGSPADLSGLRSGDRVVEVNGENVEGETHHQVVQRVLEVEHRTRLLVVDRVTDEFLKFHGLPCTEERAIEMGSLSSRSSAASSPRGPATPPPYSRQSSEAIFINKSPSSTGGVMNGSPLYRAHARLTSPVLLSPPSPKTQAETEPFNQLNDKTSITSDTESFTKLTDETSIMFEIESFNKHNTESSITPESEPEPFTKLREETRVIHEHEPFTKLTEETRVIQEPEPFTKLTEETRVMHESEPFTKLREETRVIQEPEPFTKLTEETRVIRDPKAFTKLNIESSDTKHKAESVRELSTDLSRSQTSTQESSEAVTKDLRPRLCHMTLSEQGYGFNLHCKKSRAGQFIRSVDPDSPAEHAGLRPRDRLIEVNGCSIEGLRHAEVVALVRAGGKETCLLVVDPDTDELFSRLGITPTSTHLKARTSPPIINISLKDPPITNGSPRHQSYRSSSSRSTLSETSAELSFDTSNKLTDSDHHSSDDARKPKHDGKSMERPLDPFWESGLHLSLTAAEAKQKARAKRPNKRAPPMDWSKKQQIFSNF